MPASTSFANTVVDQFLDAVQRLSTEQWREVRQRHANVRKAAWPSIMEAVATAEDAAANAKAPTAADRRRWDKAREIELDRVSDIVKRLPPELSVGDAEFPNKIYHALGLYVAFLGLRESASEDRVTKRALETIEGLFSGLLASGRGSARVAGSDGKDAKRSRGPALRATKGDYAPAEWPSLWRAFQKEIKPHAGKVRRLAIGKPATNGTIQRIEETLGTTLPGALRSVFRTVTEAVHLEWRRDTLPADIRQDFVDMYGYEPPEEGELDLSLKKLPHLEEGRREWAELYPDGRSREGRPWKDKLAFQRVSNGDLLAIDLKSEKVVYLDHEAGEMHGRILVPDFATFMTRWSRLGCVGPEWWGLEPFMTRAGLQDTGERADGWRYWLGIQNW